MMTQNIPAITTDQMREVDRLMIEEYGIKLTQMMENAGRNLAALGRDRFLGGVPTRKSVLILSGSGGNGGGGLVAARRLHNWGTDVHVFTTKSDNEMRCIPAHQLNILHRMGVRISSARDVDSLPKADLILDAVIGYSLRGAPRGYSAHLIKMANASEAPILSLDIPSGMDSTTGEVFDPCIRAAATMTLALPKTGLMKENARSVAGERFLADISVPSGLYRQWGLVVGPIFAEEEIIRLM